VLNNRSRGAKLPIAYDGAVQNLTIGEIKIKIRWEALRSTSWAPCGRTKQPRFTKTNQMSVNPRETGSIAYTISLPKKQRKKQKAKKGGVWRKGGTKEDQE